MRVIITGGTGLIGKAIGSSLKRDGHEVIILTRRPGQQMDEDFKLVKWDGRTAEGWGHLADGADAIINLAGANIAGESFLPGRWTDERKRVIHESRANAGKAVVEAVEAASKKPGVVIQSSAVGYYGTADNSTEFTEDSPAGSDYLAKTCQAWENSTAAVESMGVRRAIIRTGVVLDDDEGALARMALPFKLFAGGPLGSGKQPFPWIHLPDEVGAVRFLLENDKTKGAYNLTAPHPLTNGEFGKVLGKVLGRPSFVPVPAPVFKIMFGEVATLLLDGQRVLPKRLLDAGYTFQFPDAEAALRDIYR